MKPFNIHFIKRYSIHKSKWTIKKQIFCFLILFEVWRESCPSSAGLNNCVLNAEMKMTEFSGNGSPCWKPSWCVLSLLCEKASPCPFVQLSSIGTFVCTCGTPVWRMLTLRQGKLKLRDLGKSNQCLSFCSYTLLTVSTCERLSQ